MAGWLRVVVALLGVAVIIGGAIGLGVTRLEWLPDKSKEAEPGDDAAPTRVAGAAIPPMDASVPANLKTATFALG